MLGIIRKCIWQMEHALLKWHTAGKSISISNEKAPRFTKTRILFGIYLFPIYVMDMYPRIFGYSILKNLNEFSAYSVMLRKQGRINWPSHPVTVPHVQQGRMAYTGPRLCKLGSQEKNGQPHQNITKSFLPAKSHYN